MELSGSNIKKFLIFSQKKAFHIFREIETPKKIIYVSGNGTSLYFRKIFIFQEVTFLAQIIKLSGSNIKKFLIFSQKKVFLIFQETDSPPPPPPPPLPKKILILQEMELSYISRNESPKN